jgi:hypothetical protein
MRRALIFLWLRQEWKKVAEKHNCGEERVLATAEAALNVERLATAGMLSLKLKYYRCPPKLHASRCAHN